MSPEERQQVQGIVTRIQAIMDRTPNYAADKAELGELRSAAQEGKADIDALDAKVTELEAHLPA